MKLKINFKKTSNYIYIIFVLTNLIILFYLYLFVKKYVYYTIVPDEYFLISQNTKHNENINMKEYNDIIKKINKKSNLKKPQSVNNIFKF